MIQVNMSVSVTQPIPLTVNTIKSASFQIASPIQMINADYYEGSYEITPSSETQTIPVAYKTMGQDITVNPIPNNYGLITWDGSTLMVS